MTTDNGDGQQPEAAAEDTLLEFPCIFPIKAMGRADGDLQDVVVEILRRHGAAFGEDDVTARPSSGGKWLSVTARIRADSKAQLDAIYLDLTAHELVVYAL